MLGYYLITFKSSNHAMDGEFKTKHLQTRLITLPEDISANCGFALKVIENLDEVLKILDKNYEKVYKRWFILIIVQQLL